MEVYTFEGEGADDTVMIRDLAEAREYARTNHLALVANTYEWVDDEVVEDYRDADDPTLDD